MESSAGDPIRPIEAVGSSTPKYLSRGFAIDYFGGSPIGLNAGQRHARVSSTTSVMASPSLTRAPCLVCLRRITQVGSASVTPFFRQMRKKSDRPKKDSGVVVRLLVDMKGFGREGQWAILSHLQSQSPCSLY